MEKGKGGLPLRMYSGDSGRVVQLLTDPIWHRQQRDGILDELISFRVWSPVEAEANKLKQKRRTVHGYYSNE